MTAPLCFVDTETDGVHPGRKAWDVALIRREPSGELTERQFYVDIDLSTADPFGLKVGGFYERHPIGRYISGAVDEIPNSRFDGDHLGPAAAAFEIARMTHGAHLVGAVPSFDAEVFDRLLREFQLIPAWHHRLLCVESLTSGHLGRHVGGLRRCAEALGMTPDAEVEHTALGDAWTCVAIWNTIIKPDAITGGGS